MQTKNDLSSLTDDELILLFHKTTSIVAYYRAQQQSRKIGINSLYGSLASKYNRWFDTRLAESITKTGQVAIQWVMIYINKFLNTYCETTDIDYQIYGDTDSLYLELNQVVIKNNWDKLSPREISDKLDEFSINKLQPVIKKAFNDLLNYLNHRTLILDMARENIASRGLWNGVKKRYAMAVWDSEGVKYDKPKFKIQGLEAVKNSYPRFVRKALKESIEIILTKTEPELHELVAKLEEEIKQAPFEEISFNKNCNELSKYAHKETIFTKGCPINTRAALTYNHLLKKMKLDNRFPSIRESDKIKLCYMLLPNPTNSNVIGVPGELPKELELEKFIDYRTQFEKAFLQPLKNTTDAIGWTVEKVADLSDMFEY